MSFTSSDMLTTLKLLTAKLLSQTDSRSLERRQRFSGVALALTLLSSSITLGLSSAPSLAQDPFRATNQRPIGSKTEGAFNAIFQQGNYQQAREYLQQAESNEPLAYAMKASLAYTAQDWEALRVNATRTRESAEQLMASDPLRGNLYAAAGHFLEGAYTLSQDGTVRGTPQALNKLKQVFKHLSAAEKISPQDPEVNMLKGFMELMLSVNLPFSNAEEAIARLNQYAGPRYLADRGIAIGYRDLGQYDKALDYTNRALIATPNHPEVHYLKAQILVAIAQQQQNSALYAEASKQFKRALGKPDRLPKKLVWQVFFEYCLNEKRVDNKDRDCVPLRDSISAQPGPWGPKSDKMPTL